jgi:uncharacterized protein
MPNIDTHPAGSFCWIELGTTDQTAAKTFYASLFGWHANDMPMGPDEYYTIFQLQDRASAAAYTLRPERSPGAPPHWLLYFLTSGCDAQADKAKALGAKIHFGPETIANVGRMAIIADPQGAIFAIFQPEPRRG